MGEDFSKNIPPIENVSVKVCPHLSESEESLTKFKLSFYVKQKLTDSDRYGPPLISIFDRLLITYCHSFLRYAYRKYVKIYNQYHNASKIKAFM